MKILKTFAILTLLFTATTLTAQSAKIAWPAMDSYDQVINRINTGVEQGNDASIASFAGTLYNFSERLISKGVPTQYDSKKIRDGVAQLQAQTKKLNDLVLAKSPNASLKPIFLETYMQFRQVQNLIQNAK